MDKSPKVGFCKVGRKDYYRDVNGILTPAELVRETSPKVRTPKDILPHLADIRIAGQEHFVVFTLDGANQIIKRHVVTIGLANQSQVHPRETFFPAVHDRAVSIMIAHNHPSGNTEPSESDLTATRRLVEASKILGIPVLDHVIVAPLAFCSIRERFPAYFV